MWQSKLSYRRDNSFTVFVGRDFMLKLFISIAIGTAFMYFAARGIDFKAAAATIHSPDYVYLILAFAVWLIMGILRAIRLKIILDAVTVVPLIRVFYYNCVGYLFITLLPLRLGEFAIPIMLRKNNNIPFTRAVPSIFIERIVDLIVLLTLLYFSVSALNLPKWMTYSSYAFLLFAVIGAIALVFFYVRFELSAKIVHFLARILPASFRLRIDQILINLHEGLQIIGKPRHLIYLILMSFIVWLVGSAAMYFFYKFLYPYAPMDPLTMLATSVINVMGVSLPAGPGMMGNFQYSITATLELAGVDKNMAFTYANLYYIFGIGLTVIAGLLFLQKVNFSLKDLKMQRAETK